MPRAEDVDLRMQLVGAIERRRACHRDRMAPPGTAFGREQVVVAVASVEMRRFGQPERRAAKDGAPFADERAPLDRILLQHDAAEPVLPGTMIPEHVEQVLASILVVKERRIEAAAVQVHRVGPVAVDRRRRDEIVVKVPQRGARRARRCRAAVALHVGVNQMKQAIGVGQARRPDAAGVGIAQHVQLAGAAERPRQQPPVDEVARVMDLDPRIPLEGRRGDVVVVADANDRGIRIEAAQDRVDYRALFH